MHRLTILLGVCAAVFAAATVVQSYRLWEAQRNAEALVAAVQRAEGGAHRGTAGSLPNPPESTAAAGQEGGNEPEAASGGKKGTPSDPTGKSVPANDPGRLLRGPVKGVDLDKKRSSLQQGLQDNPKDASAWRELALVERQLGNKDAELDAYKRWVEAMPDDKRARFLAAEAFARSGMNEQALQYLADFQSMSSDNPRANAMAANLYELMKMPDEQGEALRRWVSESPDSPDAHRALGNYYRQTGQADQALSEYQQTAELQPNDSATHIQLGSDYMQMGKSAEALAEFQTAVDLSPNSTEALGRLAQAQRQTGDLPGAIENYQRIVTLDPASPAGVEAAGNVQSLQAELAASQAQTSPRP